MVRQAAAALVLAIVSMSSSAFGLASTYTDTTFVNADWTGVKFADTSIPTGSFTAASASPGGSMLLPGPQTQDYRAISHTFGGPGAGAINVTHQGNLFNWVPGPGESATTVDYSYDVKFFDPTTDLSFGAVGFSPAIFQGGAVFRLAAYDNVFGVDGWKRFSQLSLPLTSFVKMDPSTAGLAIGSPNATSPMSFGFVSSNSANQPSVVKNSGLDNYSITLNSVRLPEPTTLAALGLGATLLRRRRSM